MKKFSIFAVTVAFIISFVVINHVETHYTREGFISYIDRCNDIIEIEDSTGNIWECYESTENFNVGDNVKMSMHTNGTDFEIKDDIILKIRVDK